MRFVGKPSDDEDAHKQALASLGAEYKISRLMYGISTLHREIGEKLMGQRREKRRRAARLERRRRFRTGAASKRAIKSGPRVRWYAGVGLRVGPGGGRSQCGRASVCVEIVGSCNGRQRFSAAATRTADSLVVDSPNTAEST
jgi:hypothetical protein